MSTVKKLMAEHPDRVPVVLELIKDGVYETMKLLVLKTTPYAAFMNILRRRVNLSPREAIFVIIKCNNMMLTSNNTIGEVYQKYRDKEEEVLYLVARLENTFGNAILRHFPLQRIVRIFYQKVHKKIDSDDRPCYYDFIFSARSSSWFNSLFLPSILFRKL